MIIDVEQGSPEWLKARAGFATASCFADVLAKGKGTAESKTRRNYLIQLVTERLTGIPAETYHNKHMDWGNEWEPHARSAFEAQTGLYCKQVGFVTHPTIQWAGCSPDSLVDEDSGIEIKCPSVSSNHVAILSRGMPDEHIPQVQGNLWVTGRKFWHFISFDPRMPERLQLYVQKIERNEPYIAALQNEVVRFLSEVEGERVKLMAR